MTWASHATDHSFQNSLSKWNNRKFYQPVNRLLRSTFVCRAAFVSIMAVGGSLDVFVNFCREYPLVNQHSNWKWPSIVDFPIKHGGSFNSKMYPPSNFSYEMGRTWATVQIASQDFFVQTGGVVPPILYLESFCSWFLLNHAFSFCCCICWVSWSIQHKISLAFCSCTSWIVEASNIKSHLHFLAVEVE